MWTSTQRFSRARSGLADLFDLAESRIRVIGTKVGGVLAGNSMRLEPYAAALSLKTGKPVRLVNSRAEEFAAAAGSVPATVRVRTGVKRDGTITARAMDFTPGTPEPMRKDYPAAIGRLRTELGLTRFPHSRHLDLGLHQQTARLSVSRPWDTGGGMGCGIANGHHIREARNRSRRPASKKLPQVKATKPRPAIAPTTSGCEIACSRFPLSSSAGKNMPPRTMGSAWRSCTSHRRLRLRLRARA